MFRTKVLERNGINLLFAVIFLVRIMMFKIIQRKSAVPLELFIFPNLILFKGICRLQAENNKIILKVT